MKTLNKLKLFILAFVAIVSISTASAQCTASFNAVDNGNGNYTFTSTSVGGLSSYWTVDNSYLGWGNSVSTTFMNGTYIICLTIEDSTAGCFDQNCQTIVVTSGASCNVVGGFNFVDNGNGNYTFTSTSTGNNFGYWDFGDGGFDNVNSTVNHTYTANGIYTVSYLVGDSNAICLDTVYQTIIVTSVPSCNMVAGFTSLSNLNGQVSFTTTTTGNFDTQLYDYGDGSNGYSLAHTYAINGVYLVCVTASDSAQTCSDTYCDTVIVTNVNVASCNIASSFTAIDNGSGNYSFTNTSSGTITNYFWNFGDGITSSATSPNHTFLANGTYIVVLYADYVDSNTFNTCSDYYTYTVNVTGVTNPVSCNAGFVTYTDSNLFNGVIVINSSTGNNLTYFWDFGDGNTSTLQYPTYVYSTAGPFLLCLTVSDSMGSCTSTYCDSIGSNGIVFKQTGFTINVQGPVITGVETQVEAISEINLYPNPVKDNLTIELGLNEVSNVEVYVTNMLGNMVSVIANQEMNSGGYQLQWKTNNIPNGIYLLNIRTENSLEVKKLIVNR